ncbi:YciI family protein [Terrabacter carboxydivorans]|uniref:YCII-related domain-containing protein n=1 Tax=Terrabacter carboxydivorans TaxID=619730 RepID=A0ABP5Y015_9MICO
MADTYAYLIHERDWNSDAYLGGRPEASPDGRDPGAPGAAGAPDDMNATFPEHQAFQRAVADLGARVVGGAALQNSRHGGTVTPGAKGRLVEDAVYTDGPFPDTSEVITGFYLVETDDEDTARRVAALVPTGGHIEWRRVFPTGM